MNPLIVANWKMQLSDVDAVATAQQLAPAGWAADVEVVLCPTFTSLACIAEILRGSSVTLGAQDCAWQERGALTGDVSPVDLVSIGCRYVIIGHSERRQHLGESDTIVGKKLHAAIRAGLCPILCVGERFEERAEGKREAVLMRELEVLRGLSLVGSQRLCVAYEPMWAIGTGHAAVPSDAAQAHAFICDTVREIAGGAVADRLRVLYGGSVSPTNIAAFLAERLVHGVLVGTASQTAEGLRSIVTASSHSR